MTALPAETITMLHNMFTIVGNGDTPSFHFSLIDFDINQAIFNIG